jgi:hypothetical protein
MLHHLDTLPMALVAVALVACGGEVDKRGSRSGGAGGEASAQASGSVGTSGDGGSGGVIPAPDGCTCRNGGTPRPSCGPDMSCVPIDCGDGVVRVCQAGCAPDEVTFYGSCPPTAECDAIDGRLHCAEPVPCTEAGEPLGACATPFEVCSPSPPQCPDPRSQCSEDNVWVERPADEDCAPRGG